MNEDWGILGMADGVKTLEKERVRSFLTVSDAERKILTMLPSLIFTEY